MPYKTFDVADGVMIIAVGSTAQVRGVLPGLTEMLGEPLATVERVQVCKRDGQLLARPPVLPAVDPDGRQVRQKLMIFTSEATRHDGAPVHRALVRRLLESGTASGATVLRGIWGFHGDHKPHGDKLIQFGRQVPVISIVVDTRDTSGVEGSKRKLCTRLTDRLRGDDTDSFTGLDQPITSEIESVAVLTNAVFCFT